jgi:hypothetical protein
LDYLNKPPCSACKVARCRLGVRLCIVRSRKEPITKEPPRGIQDEDLKLRFSKGKSMGFAERAFSFVVRQGWFQFDNAIAQGLHLRTALREMVLMICWSGC